ncbi:MAG: hypothetical protein Q4B26_04195 [Eubacteriales bacterium]|nr:hypothetical protein [Eubacteriales bacterium]
MIAINGSSAVTTEASEILPMVIREYGRVLYPQELGVHMHDIEDDWYDEIMEYLDESIQEIYEYQTDVQFENFCRVFGEACEFIRKRHTSADRNKEETLDPDNLPFN